MLTIISGTNRPDSKTRKVADYYQQVLLQHNQKSVVLDLHDLPPEFLFSAMYHNAGRNEAFNLFRNIIQESEKFVFIVPEYNGSFPGVLKAFIDGLDHRKSFANKKCALVGISAGNMAGALALSHLTDILNYMGMNVLALKIRLPQISSIFIEGKIKDDFLTNLLETQAKTLIEF